MTLRSVQTLSVHTGDLLLVNAANPIRPEAKNPVTEPLMADPKGETRLAPTAAKMLDFCLNSCRAVGQIVPTSGYRPHEEQREIYRETLAAKGQAFTSKYVALPGCSEHETGLAVDLASAEGTADAICPTLPHTGIFARFRARAADYGFIERYPEGKTNITGIGYEPWHFRYVGWPHARVITSHGLVLEEYISLLQTHNSPGKALCYEESGRKMRIFTIYPERAGEVLHGLSKAGSLWQASGNNVDGLVVTSWQ